MHSRSYYRDISMKHGMCCVATVTFQLVYLEGILAVQGELRNRRQARSDLFNAATSRIHMR
jgi:hypothetical protein